MSKLRPVILMAALALLAPASPSGAGEPLIPDRCEAHAGVGERVMRHRQETNDLERTWRMAGLIRDPELSRLAQRLVSEAYRQPRQASVEARERLASEFADAARAACRASASVDATARVVHGTAFFQGDADGVPFFLAPGDGPRPLLVHIQGSGCEPVFILEDGAHIATAGQDLVHALADGRFAVLVADKVGVEPFTRVAGADGTAGSCREEFLGMHSLDNWILRLGAAIDAARTSGHVDPRAGVRVLGLSEGAIAAARLARVREDVTHTTFIAGFGCDQWRDMLVVARRKAEAEGVEAARSAATAMEQGLGAVAADPESNAIFEGQTHLFWSSFGRACPAEDLAASESDVFLAYGTADEEVDAGGVEAITAARIAARKPVRVERIIGGSHVLDTPDTEPFQNLVGVLAAAIDWMVPD